MTAEPNAINIFMEDTTHLLTIQKDGTIIKGPGFTTVDEASLEFWKAVENSKKGEE